MCHPLLSFITFTYHHSYVSKNKQDKIKNHLQTMRNKNIDPYCLERGYSYNDNNNDNNNYNNYYNGSNVTEMNFMCPGAGKKKYVSENMQDQIPIAYAIWKILIILVMTILCIVCIRQINVYVNMQKLKKKNICTANLFKQLFLLVAAMFLLYMLVWSVAGLYYAFKLNKMITSLRSFKIRKNNRNASVSQKYKALHKLSRIRQTVIALTIIGLSNLTNQIISNFVIDICCDKKDQLKENYFYLIKISIIHFGEAVILERLLNTIRTIDYEQKTFKNKEVDTLQSNASVKTDISSEMINLELTTHSNLSTSNADISIYEENDHVKLMNKNESENNKNKNSWASLQRE
jgi:hypothetical protein